MRSTENNVSRNDQICSTNYATSFVYFTNYATSFVYFTNYATSFVYFFTNYHQLGGNTQGILVHYCTAEIKQGMTGLNVRPCLSVMPTLVPTSSTVLNWTIWNK